MLNHSPVDREERLEAVDGGAGPRPHLESGRADQDEGDHGEDGLGRRHQGQGESEGTGRCARSVRYESEYAKFMRFQNGSIIS